MKRHVHIENGPTGTDLMVIIRRENESSGSNRLYHTTYSSSNRLNKFIENNIAHPFVHICPHIIIFFDSHKK